jgi:hypothetical protein
VRAEQRVSWAFLGVAGLHVAGLFLDRRLLPYGATLAIVMLMAVVLVRPPGTGRHRWSRRLAVAGLGLLAASAALVDTRTGGFGRPDGLTAERDGQALAEITLLAVSASVLAAAVLCRAGRLMRLRHLPSGVFGLIVLAILGGVALYPSVSPGEKPPDLRLRTAVLILLAIAVILVVLAANAALFSRPGLRLAAAGLLPLLALTLSVLPMALRNDLISPQRDPDYRPSVTNERERFYIATVEFGAAPMEPPPLAFPDPALTGRFPPAPPARVAAEEDAGIAAVPGPPDWSGSVWEGPIGWSRSVPALAAAAFLLGLAAFAGSLLSRRAELVCDR